MKYNKLDKYVFGFMELAVDTVIIGAKVKRIDDASFYRSKGICIL